jgi:dienelactone hydrolase
MPEPIIYSDRTTDLHGLLYRPAAPNGRAALVVHEANGIGRNVRRRAAMLADLGYIAFVADLYGGGRGFSGDEAVRRMDALRADPAAFRARVAAGLARLLEIDGVDPARVAAIGYCFGGMAVLELARAGADLAAVVSFHGLLGSPAPARPGEVKAKILACSGALDPLVPPDDLAAFQREMAAAGADWQLIVYGRALHSFTNPNVRGMGDPRMDHDPSADRQSWAAALRFLDEALGPEPV